MFCSVTGQLAIKHVRLLRHRYLDRQLVFWIVTVPGAAAVCDTLPGRHDDTSKPPTAFLTKSSQLAVRIDAYTMPHP
jgi:hypothetical protein